MGDESAVRSPKAVSADALFQAERKGFRDGYSEHPLPYPPGVDAAGELIYGAGNEVQELKDAYVRGFLSGVAALDQDVLTASRDSTDPMEIERREEAALEELERQARDDAAPETWDEAAGDE